MNWLAISFDWHQVRAFLATAEEVPFSGAANRFREILVLDPLYPLNERGPGPVVPETQAGAGPAMRVAMNAVLGWRRLVDMLACGQRRRIR